jgi:hypothetical protein
MFRQKQVTRAKEREKTGKRFRKLPALKEKNPEEENNCLQQGKQL